MADIPVKPSYTTDDAEHVYMFDHMGREIKFTGYEGGVHYLSSSVVSDASIRSMLQPALLEEDLAPVARVTHGNFGERTNRRERREDYDA